MRCIHKEIGEKLRGRIITTLTLKSFIGVNADTGELLWHIKHETYYDENIMTPVFHDGEVFISTLVGSIKWRVHVKDGKVSLEKIWRTPQLENHMGGVILVDDNLHGSSVVHNRLFVCLDWKTGRIRYADQCVGLALTYADGMLYALCTKRRRRCGSCATYSYRTQAN